MASLSKKELEKRTTAEVINMNYCGKGLMLGNYNCSTLTLQEGKDVKCLRYDCPYRYFNPPQKQN